MGEKATKRFVAHVKTDGNFVFQIIIILTLVRTNMENSGGEGFSKPKTSEFRGVGRRLNQNSPMQGKYMGIWVLSGSRPWCNMLLDCFFDFKLNANYNLLAKTFRKIVFNHLPSTLQTLFLSMKKEKKHLLPNILSKDRSSWKT